MIVVGGTYDERCSEPTSAELAGSGLRAATFLSNVTDVTFVTACDEPQSDTLNGISSISGMQLSITTRSGPVGFDYWTPLSAPSIVGRSVTVDSPLAAVGDAVLCFGMIEATASADADFVVVDPQRPRDLTPIDRSGFNAKHFALVANSQETRSLAGEDDVPEAAKALLRDLDAEVVVTKRGARGALVTTSESQTEVGALPTSRVWPLGSGDVFAAGFGWAWMTQGANPVEAAEVGSRAAAFWCSRRSVGVDADYLQTGPDLAIGGRGCVYLAGPFFSLGERWLTDLVYQSLRTLGDEVFSPFHDVGLGGTDVAEKDIGGLEGASAVLALMDQIDAGTSFEVGWARKKECPVVVYAEKVDPEALKMLEGTGCEIQADLSTAVYRAIWHSLNMLP